MLQARYGQGAQRRRGEGVEQHRKPGRRAAQRGGRAPENPAVLEGAEAGPPKE